MTASRLGRHRRYADAADGGHHFAFPVVRRGFVVVREAYTRHKVLNRALATIEPSKLLGMVLNEAWMLQLGYDRYYESYGKNSKLSKRATSDGSDRV